MVPKYPSRRIFWPAHPFFEDTPFAVKVMNYLLTELLFGENYKL